MNAKVEVEFCKDLDTWTVRVNGQLVTHAQSDWMANRYAETVVKAFRVVGVEVEFVLNTKRQA